MKSKSRLSAAAAMLLLIGLLLWWTNRPHADILPAGPNPFVGRVTIAPLGPSGAPFDDTIIISAKDGAYSRVELHPMENLPETFQGREVAPPHRWPISFVIYRPGRPTGPEAVELTCHLPGTPFVERPKREDVGRVPPPILISVGTTSHRSRFKAFKGTPDLPAREPDEIAFWTFLFPADLDDPVGEYVYEVRLWPTAKWVSKIRWERGEPLVLRRGLLIATDGAIAR